MSEVASGVASVSLSSAQPPPPPERGSSFAVMAGRRLEPPHPHPHAALTAPLHETAAVAPPL